VLTRIFVTVLLVVGAGVAAVGARGADPPAAPTIISGPDNPTNSQTAEFVWAVQEGLTYQCLLDEAAFADCTSPHSYIDPLAEGGHTFQVKAIDAAVASDPASHTWTIDLTAPETTIDSAPGDPSNDSSPTFAFSASEPGATFECELDGGGYAACGSPRTYPGPLADGPHTFKVKSTDAAGNANLTEATHAWTIDTTAPATTIDVAPADPSNDSTPTFEFSSSEAGSTFQCKLDSGSFATCVSPKSVSVSAGMHTFSVRATDAAGNVGPTASYTWTVDTTAPAMPQLRSKPPNPSNDPMPKFSWEVAVGVTYVCSVDGISEICTSGNNVGPLSEGPHTFEVRAKDAAGNLSAPATWNWTVDLTPPGGVTGTPDRAPDANGWYKHGVTVVFTSTDPTATCTPPITYAGPDDESVTVAGTCTDPATNHTNATVLLKYDGTAPMNVSGAPTGTPINGWYASPVVVTFTGTDATSGIQSCTAATYSGPDGTGVSVEGMCTDNAANASTPAFSSTFKYDDTAPEVGLTAPADGSATSDTTPRFTGTTNNGPADLNTVTVSLSGPTPITLVAPVAADGSWSVSPANQLAAGDYQVQTTQTDEVGRSDTSPAHAFTIDPALPRVQISSPAHGTVTKNASLTISGTAGVGAAFEPTVKVSIYEGTSSSGAPLLELAAPVSPDGWSVVTTPLADGVYTLAAEQSDLAGGTASDSVAVEIDTTPPEPLTGATAVSGYGYVKLHWTRPLTWKTTDKVVITKKRGSSAPTIVYQGAGTLFKDGRVRNGDTYTYTLLPRDAVGNEGVSLSKRARPTGFLAPRHGTHALDPPLVRWVDVPKSTYANIQLYLVTSVGMKKIWSVWPITEKLQLKSRWVYQGSVYRLRADRRYRVYGWPGFGAKSERRYGEWFGWVEFTYR
jgi:large repetitive protein